MDQLFVDKVLRRLDRLEENLCRRGLMDGEPVEPKVVSVEEIRVKQGIHAGREYGVCELEAYGDACDKNGQRRRDADYKELREAAPCIQHWHDTMYNKKSGECEGMVVSAEHVRKLWEALQNIKPLED